MEESQRTERLLKFIPDYIVGFVWLLAMLAGLAAMVEPRDARTWVATLVPILAPFHVPDLAVGFLLAIFGVLLPYALAVIASPLSSGLAGMMLRRWYQPNPERVTIDHTKAVLAAIKTTCGVPPPHKHAISVLLSLMEQQRSPIIEHINAQWDKIYIQSRVLLPVSVLTGVATYIVLGQSTIAALLAIAVGLGTMAGVSHSAATALRSWEETIILDFFVVFPFENSFRHTSTDDAMPSRN